MSEWNNDRVSVFTFKGQFVISFGVKGDKPGQFNGPAGLTVDHNRDRNGNGVCEYKNNRVQIIVAVYNIT